MEAIARFTIDGSDALETRVAKLCETAAAGVRSRIPKKKLEGLLLAGGYGRGEGGVLATADGDQLYNDLEFYALLRGDCRVNERLHGPALHALGEELTRAAGVEVEFKILSRRKLQTTPCSMFFHDLVQGHRRLAGGPELLDGCEHHRRAEDIPLSEATRLLMNRCSGLLFAWERLSGPNLSSEAADFVGRNHAKAQLAFGDVVLTAHQRYHSSCRQRHQRLQELRADLGSISLGELRAHHRAGVDFKLRPRRAQESRAVLLERQTEISNFAAKLWLWLEGRRLGCRFADAWEYAQSSVNKCAETHPLRNLVLNAATFRRGGLAPAKMFRYPRERLFEALSLLLWEPRIAENPDRLRLVQQRIGAGATAFPDLVAAYANVWRRFN